ncbi:MAG: sulfite exporter TauE/SafE family protein [Hyphomonadaceae bacterium]|nr:sulfite exporter TauE/SafE family protein [Hyphomonadaceae bacterium]
MDVSLDQILTALDGAWRLAPIFALFLGVGFLAQLVDGALGMAYGVVSSTVLLSFGVPPAQASAIIHAAETATTGVSGASHLLHRNIDWTLFLRLAPAGIIGGVLGAYVLTGMDETLMKAVVVAYLGVLGLLILRRAFRPLEDREPHLKRVIPLGVAGGFLDASGGGGWGPIVTSTLLGRGHAPRYAIGTVNTTEFLVTVAISATFLWAAATGRFELPHGFQGAGAALAGLVLGGVFAAPFAGLITKMAPPRVMFGAVGVLVTVLALWQGVQVWPRFIANPTVVQLTALVAPS